MADLEKLRHAQIVVVDSVFLTELLANRLQVRFDPPLPQDAQIVAVDPEWRVPSLRFKVVSWHWPRVPDGTIPPDWLGTVRWEPAAGRDYLAEKWLRAGKEATNG